MWLEGKAFRVPHLRRLNMISSNKSSIYNFQIFTFKILVKPQHYVVKHYMNIYMTINVIIIIIIIINILIFTIFETIFILSFWNKSLERMGCAKSRLVQIDRAKITSDRSCCSEMFFKTGDQLKILEYSQEGTYTGISFK